MKDVCKKLLTDIEEIENQEHKDITKAEATYLLEEYNELVTEVNHSNEIISKDRELEHFKTLRYEIEILHRAHEILEKYRGIESLNNYDERKFCKSDRYFMQQIKKVA